jgi:hypothetical protein
MKMKMTTTSFSIIFEQKGLGLKMMSPRVGPDRHVART